MDLLTVFQSMWDGHPNRISVAKHCIELLDDHNLAGHSATYPAESKTQEFEKSEIEKSLKDNIIEPVQTKRATPIVLATKEDGSLLFRVDYRQLNAETTQDSYPVPRMKECINLLGKFITISTIDANRGYWQVEIDEAISNKTAFTSLQSLFRFIRMLFGLGNVPGTFRRTMGAIPSSVWWQYALV